MERIVQFCDGRGCNNHSVEHPLYPTYMFEVAPEATKYLSEESGEKILHLCENCLDTYIDNKLEVNYENYTIKLKDIQC